jgi:hypothetical protein
MARRFQFSIRFLLVATVAVAAGAAVVGAEPSNQSVLAMSFLTVLYATAALVGVAMTHGKSVAAE